MQCTRERENAKSTCQTGFTEFCTNVKKRDLFFNFVDRIDLPGIGLQNGNHKSTPAFTKRTKFGAFSLNVESRKPTAGHSALFSSQSSLVMFIRTIQKLQQQCISCAVLYGNHKDKDVPYKTLPCTCVTTDIVYSNAPQRMHFSLFLWGNSTACGWLSFVCYSTKKSLINIYEIRRVI